MRELDSSFTASLVAFGRGLGRPGLPEDPWAAQLVRPGFSHLLRASAKRRWLRRWLARSTCGLATHMAMRTAMIDMELNAAVKRGCEQIVILGAGLDTRALRLDACHGCQVFEVDKPASQQTKQLGLQRVPRNLHFVAVDFERDSLPDRLVAAGFDPNRPVVWILEGVTMYLSAMAIAQTLSDVAEVSASGSSLLVTYAHKGSMVFGDKIAALSRDVFHFSGEYLQSWFSGDDFTRLLREQGFTVNSDTFDRDWAEELGVRHFFSGLFKVEHLVDARC